MDTSISRLLRDLVSVSGDTQLKEWCGRLYDFYRENERHSYAEITRFILNEEGGIEYSYRILPHLKRIRDSLEDETNQKRIGKLIDHIELEQVRYEYLSALINVTVQEKYVEISRDQIEGIDDLLMTVRKQASDASDLLTRQSMETSDLISRHRKENNRISADIEKVESDLKSIDENIKEVSDLAKKARKKVQKAQAENITILGIFASIVLAFTGGMMFSSSVLENIGNASAYRILLVCEILSFTLINAVIALVLYIHRIIYGNVTGEPDWKKRVRTFARENIFWIAVNLLIVCMIAATVHAWEHSSEKAVLDQRNVYQEKLYERDEKELYPSLEGE